ncbi:MAG TPA: PIN domain-containing protein [Cyclobacteriaceae bacterium]|nr:PIN domain-containing protein [Cyclobacteriaceae bacterium]
MFIEAGRISWRYKFFTAGVGLIDCYILAAAKIYKLEVLSLDKKLLKAYSAMEE